MLKGKISAEWFIEKTGLLIWMLFGGYITAASLSVIEFFKGHEKQALTILFVAGCLIFLGIYFLYNKVKQQSIQTKSAALSLSESNTNPLEQEFRNKTIRLHDFFDHFHIGHTNKTFKNCRINGPGMIYMPFSSMIDCNLKYCQIVIIKDGAPFNGATIFYSARMIECEISGCTLLLTRSEYNSLPQFHGVVPVLNE